MRWRRCCKASQSEAREYVYEESKEIIDSSSMYLDL